MTTCAICRRAASFGYVLDGTTSKVCVGCIGRALKEAAVQLDRERTRITFERWRKMGFA